MSELDKKKTFLSKNIAVLRGWIQAAATLLTNIHIPNLWKGKIYQGSVKNVCVPGLNCYSCPAATGACPIGAFPAIFTATGNVVTSTAGTLVALVLAYFDMGLVIVAVGAVAGALLAGIFL